MKLIKDIKDFFSFREREKNTDKIFLRLKEDLETKSFEVINLKEEIKHLKKDANT